MGGNLFCLYNGGFLMTAAYFVSLNFWYHINIIFDHDTFETAVENHYDGTDWLKLQVSNSGNCLNGNMIWTRLFGGINYQIEHHLFPNMSYIHYPTIAPIVKQYCAEHNIPYMNHPTLIDAYQSYLKMLKAQNSDSVRLS
jgi:fatty acid desaturase